MIISVDFKKRKKNKMDHPCCQTRGKLYFCPYLNWYLKDHCGFLNKRECQDFLRQCGVLFNTNK